MKSRQELVEAFERRGWTVEFQDWCEDSETPGFPGQIAGVCIPDREVVKVGLLRDLSGTPRTEEEICAILAHELEHVDGAEWATNYPEFGLRCGGRRS